MANDSGEAAPLINLSAAAPDLMVLADEQGRADQQNSVAPQKPETQADADPDVVIELKRSERAHKTRADQATTELTDLQSWKTQMEPVAQFIGLAQTDPHAFITECADLLAIDPERMAMLVMEAGAGGEVALSPEDKIARLERELSELRNPTKTEDSLSPEAKQAHDNELQMAQVTLDAVADRYPLSAANPDAAHAAFLVRVKHWESNGRNSDGSNKPGYKTLPYHEAIARVESALQARAGANSSQQSQASQNANPTHQPKTGGLSTAHAGAFIPGDSRILTDDEIRADLLRTLGR